VQVGDFLTVLSRCCKVYTYNPKVKLGWCVTVVSVFKIWELCYDIYSSEFCGSMLLVSDER